MAASAARTEANRRNAQKSTGPRTEEGKARSRMNAFKHGLAGAGDLLAAHEDARAVAERADDFARELGARGRVGRLFARRAAVMSLRLEVAEAHTLALRVARMAEAREQFDQDRAEALADLAVGLDGPDDPRPILDELEAEPEGVSFLVERWAEIVADLRIDAADETIARRWLGRDDPAATDRAALIAAADAEHDRLRRRSAATGAAEQAVAEARKHAAHLAAFDPSPEAETARRHEAAAERSMYRAMRAIAEHRRAYEAEAPAGLPAHPSPRPVAPTPSAARPEPPRPAPPSSPPLGSFRPDDLPPLDADLADLFDRRAARDLPADRRPNRPDLAKLSASRR